MSPHLIEAVAKTRMDDYLRAAKRRRKAAVAEPDATPTILKMIRPRRRLRFGIA